MRYRIYIWAFLGLLLFAGCAGNSYYKLNRQALFCAAGPGNTCNWMNELLQQHPDIALVDICLPGAHDAGMYVTQHCTAFANTGNTQTQYLPMKDQLEAGLRIFDIRPSYYQNEFYTQHATGCNGLGCKGDQLKNILQATRVFLDAHRELVIINLNHYCNTSPQDTALLNLIHSVLGARVYKQAIATSKPFIELPIKDLLGDSATGKVILLMEGVEYSPANKAQGYFSHREFKTAGGWTNDNVYANLLAHQLNNFDKYKGNGNALFEFSWQITQHNEQALRTALAPHARVAIVNGANKANMALLAVLDSLVKCGSIRAGKIPNIIWSDFADTMVSRQCMKLSKLNLSKR